MVGSPEVGRCCDKLHCKVIFLVKHCFPNLCWPAFQVLLDALQEHLAQEVASAPFSKLHAGQAFAAICRNGSGSSSWAHASTSVQHYRHGHSSDIHVAEQKAGQLHMSALSRRGHRAATLAHSAGLQTRCAPAMPRALQALSPAAGMCSPPTLPFWRAGCSSPRTSVRRRGLGFSLVSHRSCTAGAMSKPVCICTLTQRLHHCRCHSCMMHC